MMRTIVLPCILIGVLAVSPLIDPAGAAERPLVFYSDTREGEIVHRAMVTAMTAVNPQAVFMAGDLVTRPAAVEDWKTFADITTPLRTVCPLYAAVGNHDESPDSFKHYTGLDSKTLWYAVTVGTIGVIVLDSIGDLSRGSDQYRWLVQYGEHLPSHLTHLIVLFHRPLYTAGPHPDDERGLRPVLLPLFKRFGVDLVVNGHNHAYERYEREGMTFIVTGGGGSPLYQQKTTPAGLKRYEARHHFVAVTKENGALRLRAYDASLTCFDDVRI